MPKWIKAAEVRSLALVGHDIIALAVSIMAAYQLRLEYSSPSVVDWHLVWVMIVVISTLYVSNSYQITHGASSLALGFRTLFSIVVAGVFIAAFVYIIEPVRSVTLFWQGNLSLSFLIFAVWSSVLRYLVSFSYQRWSSKPCWLFIVDPSTRDQFDRIEKSLSSDTRIESIHVRDSERLRLELDKQNRTLKAYEDGEGVYENQVAGLVLGSTEKLSSDLIRQFMILRLHGVNVLNYAEFYEERMSLIPIIDVRDLWSVFSEGFSLQPGKVNWRLKRAIDFLVSLIAFVIVAPLIALLTISIRVTSPGSVMFVQERIGLGGEKFRLLKLRTMRTQQSADVERWTDKEDERITRIGRVLRKYRLDELPQLINVIKGEMSLVGPRPEQPNIVRRLEVEIPFYDVRHLVKPGISGWAQVNYPYGASVEDAKRKLEFDLYYMKHYSIFLDFYVALRTLRVMISRGGR
jgi:exopolysaccharide biosynthesis polyprenyl glycosylphosphotransferase|tara:strand:- start:556 stop:1941 length:1386 start_codon:yes stop_codon:yes gene_type:complete